MFPDDTASASSTHADLAEVVLRVARELTFREHPDAVRLTPTAGNVMRFIDEHPGAAPSEIAEAVGLLRSNLSGALRDLERLGFVERRSDPTDGRGALLFPTAASAQNLDAIRADWATWVGDALGERGLQHEGVMVEMLEQLAAGLVRDRRARDARS